MSGTLRLGTGQQFAAVRQFLDACAFTDANAAERLGFARLDQIGRYELMDHAKRDVGLKVRDALGALVKLFLCGWILPAAETEEFIPAPVLSAMEALGLLERQQGGWVSTVMLYQTSGLYLASDRFVNPDGSEPDTKSDFVFLTLQRTGSDFMSNLPDSPCAAFLDLGTGNGIAGLYAAKNFAKHVWAVDITGRSVLFAEFDRRLNGVENMTVLQGDLYAPVSDVQFDRIALHPPYSIAVTGYVYAFGGDDGEYLVRRAVSEAPAVLAPGGLLYCWTTATNRKGAPLEQRVRGMLGGSADDFDVAVLVEEIQDPDTYAVATIAAHKGHLRELQSWRQRFARLEVVDLAYGAIYVKRHGAPGERPVTLRRTRSRETGRRTAEWLFAWEQAAAQPSRDALLLASRPAAVSAAELQVRHQMRDGTLVPVEYALRGLTPFDARLTCGPWLAFLFSRCNGQRTGAELLAEVAPRLPENGAKELFLSGLSALVSGGFVEIDAFPLP
jgi:SAM-dependent methyltransferase